MKGFIYILEITIALTIILTIFIAISSFEPSGSMERTVLVEAGDNVMRLLKSSDVYEIMQGNASSIESLLPKNMRFGVKIEGVPKDNITVGCAQPSMCSYISELLPGYRINNRTVKFTIVQFDINALNHIPQNLDAVVFVNYTDYTTRKSNITNYLQNGGIVVGINGTFSYNGDFNEIFGLTAGSPSSGNMKFPAYDPQGDETEKYFLGTGFDIRTDTVSAGRKTGNWYIWNERRTVNASSTNVIIENKTASEGFIRYIPVGGFFRLRSPHDNNFYTFMIRKINWDTSVSIMPMNTTFVFGDITESIDVMSDTSILSTPSGSSGMGTNGTAIWISDFPLSDEFSSLARSAIASKVKRYDPIEINYAKKYATVSAFYPLCCDMPEVAKLTLYLWYRI